MNILNPGYDLNLRPMRYHNFMMYRNAIKNTWTVEEVDFQVMTLQTFLKCQKLNNT